MSCPDSLVTITRVFSLVLSATCFIFYLIILVFACRLFKKFHVFFIVFYISMIFTRSVAIFIRACGYFLVLFREEGVPSELLDVLWIAKFAAQAAALCCILERSYATFFANNYENFKRCNFITACSGLSYIDASSDLGRKIHSFGYGIFFVVTTTMLIKINRRLVKKSSAGKCRLSERYQLAENIKALRLLVPFVLSITGNAIMLSIGIIFFNVDTVFSLPECRLVPSYLPVFYLVLITTTILNLAAPLYVLYHNRKTLQNRKIGVSEIRNVLGVNIVGNGVAEDKEQYFQQYRNQWA